MAIICQRLDPEFNRVISSTLNVKYNNNVSIDVYVTYSSIDVVFTIYL